MSPVERFAPGRLLPAALRALSLAAIVATPPAAALAMDRHAVIQESAADRGAALLPQVLGAGDAARYKRIFALQKDGRWREADAAIRKLRSRLLLGHIKAQRYLHPEKYRSRYGELRGWLRRYADHPDARRIYKLAVKRRPKGAAGPRRPQSLPRGLPTGPAAERSTRVDGYVSDRQRSANTRRRVDGRLLAIRRAAQRGQLDKARRLLSSPSTRALLDPTETAIARSHLAIGHYFRGSNEEAHRLFGLWVEGAGRHMPMAYWVAGLSAYRMGRHEEAAARFEAMIESGRLSDWTYSAGAFWAARSYLHARKPDRFTRLMTKAAARKHTFYGLLATRVLDMEGGFDWRPPRRLTADRIDSIRRHKAGRRALALLQVENYERAERELVLLTSRADEALRDALRSLAERTGLANLALRLAATGDRAGSARRIEALYPIPRWQPEGSFTIDRAMIYALMRQESRFQVRARSYAGARGLMQLMPATAAYVARRPFRGAARARLYDPELNLSIAQRYLRYLIDHETVENDILLMAVAYNAGPGNLAKWRRQADRRNLRDPLLFIESIPSRETRIFVERILANLWIYRDRLGQSAPSLDDLASGRAPRYKALDPSGFLVARNARN